MTRPKRPNLFVAAFDDVEVAAAGIGKDDALAQARRAYLEECRARGHEPDQADRRRFDLLLRAHLGQAKRRAVVRERVDANVLELRFENADSDLGSLSMRVHREGLGPVVAWYGAYFADDDYRVYVEADEVELDQNGQLVLKEG